MKIGGEMLGWIYKMFMIVVSFLIQLFCTVSGDNCRGTKVLVL